MYLQVLSVVLYNKVLFVVFQPKVSNFFKHKEKLKLEVTLAGPDGRDRMFTVDVQFQVGTDRSRDLLYGNVSIFIPEMSSFFAGQ